MKNQAKLNLNLASAPLRNRRLFFMLGACLLIVFVGTSVLGIDLHRRFKSKQVEIQTELDAINGKLAKERKEETRYNALIEQKLAQYKISADYINGLIYRKSFPWMDFFTAMEEALPESSYIVSLMPYPADGTEMEVRFQAVFTNLNELLQFIKKLDSKGFEDINIVSESQSAQGLLLSEISVRYERHV
jgi:hypothetical protein